MNIATKSVWVHYVIELVLLILGISIAFWLENKATNNKETQLNMEFLSEINEDLSRDTALLRINVSNNEKKIAKMMHGLSLVQQRASLLIGVSKEGECLNMKQKIITSAYKKILFLPHAIEQMSQPRPETIIATDEVSEAVLQGE